VLTNSHVAAQDRLFETLDTTSRRLRFPEDREVIITDTVGFIRGLPQELVGAFRTTLDELREADLLLHVVDVNARDIEVQLEAVVAILDELRLGSVPRWLVFNKCDQAPPQQVDILCRRFDAIGISALQPTTLYPLLARLETYVRSLSLSADRAHTVLEQDHEPTLASRR
jgi:GTP-binding protein HflX